jgi:hypothetical protein
MAAQQDFAGSGPPMTITLNLDRVKSIIRALREDEEIGSVMALVGINIADSPRLESMEEISAPSITAILNNIETFGTAQGKVTFVRKDLDQVIEYSNVRKYKNAEIFQQQVVFTFYKLVQQQIRTNPRHMEFEEVKNYLERLISTEHFGDRLPILLECKRQTHTTL